MSENEFVSLTCDGLQKLKRWMLAVQEVKHIEQQHLNARSEKTNATNEFGKWALPDDAKVDEVFNFWIGDGILSVKTISTSEDYEIFWRKKPTGKLVSTTK